MTICAASLCLVLSLGTVYVCPETGTCQHIGWIERHHLDDETEMWVITDGQHLTRLRARWDGRRWTTWPDSDRLTVGGMTIWRRR